MQTGVSCAHGVGIEPVTDVHSLARMYPESMAGSTEDRPVRFGYTDFSGDQHHIEREFQPQCIKLGTLVVSSRVGDRGQSQSKGAQRPQARQRIIEQPPGSPDGCRPAFLTPDDLAVAEEFTPAREEVLGALPQHRLKADPSGQVALVMLIGQRTPVNPRVIGAEQLTQSRASRCLIIDQRRIHVEAYGGDFVGNQRCRAQLRRKSHPVHVRCRQRAPTLLTR